MSHHKTSGFRRPRDLKLGTKILIRPQRRSNNIFLETEITRPLDVENKNISKLNTKYHKTTYKIIWKKNLEILN